MLAKSCGKALHVCDLSIGLVGKPNLKDDNCINRLQFWFRQFLIKNKNSFSFCYAWPKEPDDKHSEPLEIHSRSFIIFSLAEVTLKVLKMISFLTI